MSGRLRTTAVLGSSSLVAGLLAYVLFALLTRHLGPVDAAPVSIVWTYWGLSAAAITFPVQHWLAHAVAAHGDFDAVRTGLSRLAALVVVLAAGTGLVAWAARDLLFGRDDVQFPLLIALMSVGALVMGVSRGLLTATARFGTLGATLLGEQVVRVLLTVVLAVAGVQDEALFGLVIVAGSFVVLLWPPLLRIPGARGAAGTLSFRALGSAASAQLLAQLVLTSAPIVLAVQGGAPARVTALFVTLAVFRAPFILAQSQVAPLTGRWTMLIAEGRTRDLKRVRLVLLAGAGPLALAAAGVGVLVGDPVVRLIFGPGVEVGHAVSALVAAGSTIAVANLGATVLAIAHARPQVALRAWGAGCLLAGAVLALPWSPELRTAAAFGVAEAVAFAVMLGSLWRRSPETSAR